MKVLLLATAFTPGRGGTDRFAVNLSRGLAAAGCDVRVVTTDGGPLNWKFVKLLPLLACAIRACLDSRPDRVIAMLWTHEGSVALALRWLFGVEYAVVAHGSEIVQYRARWGYARAMRTVLGRAAAVVANSAFTRAALVESGCPGDRITVINPPVEAPAGAEAVDADARFGVRGRRVLLTAARLVPRKGHAQAIEVLARLADRFPDLVYLIVGEGPARGDLERLAARLGVSDRVIMAGRVSDADLDAAYRRAEVYVAPSTEVDGDVEGFGMALAEAGARGCPVVAARSGGVADAIIDGRTGVTIDPGDVDGLERAVSSLLVDRERGLALGAAAEAHVHAHLSVAGQGHRMRAALASIGEAPRGAWLLCAALIAMGLVAVLPRAVIDYGQSGDALDNARDAMLLARVGLFDAIPDMIRWPPGIPLFIAMLAGVVPWGGHVAANLLVFVTWAVAVLLFAAAVRAEAHPGPLTILFAATPFLLLNAAVAQDFVPGLATALAAYVALSRGRYALAGLLLGLGVGLRVTNVLLIAPALAYVWCAEREWRTRLRAALPLTLLVPVLGLSFYAPFILESGLGTSYFTPLPGHGGNPFRGGWMTAAYNWLSVFGLVATLGIVGLGIARRRAIAAAVRHDWTARRASLVFAGLTILVYAGLSLRFTMKAEYVMPAVPFVFVLIGRWFSRRQIVAVTALVASYAVVAVDVKGGVPGRREIALTPAAGVLVEDWQRRHDVRDLRAGVEALRALDRAVVLTGMAGVLTGDNHRLEPSTLSAISDSLPPAAGISEHRSVGTMVHRLRGTSVFFVTSLSREHVEQLRREGYPVYMFSEYAASAAVHVHHYDPYALRLDVLPIFGREAFYRRRLTAS